MCSLVFFFFCLSYSITQIFSLLSCMTKKASSNAGTLGYIRFNRFNRYINNKTHTGCSTRTIESILVEITQRSQRGAEPAEGLLTEEVGLAWLQQQRASLEVHVHLTQLLQTPIGPSTHEHWSSHHQVIQTRQISKARK